MCVRVCVCVHTFDAIEHLHLLYVVALCPCFSKEEWCRTFCSSNRRCHGANSYFYRVACNLGEEKTTNTLHL